MGSSKRYSDGFWKVYVHINKANNKKYVGITSQKVEYRWNNGEGYHNNPYFNSSIHKYGWENFEHIVLYDKFNKEEAEEKEKELIAKWHTQEKEFGYNVAAGGESCTGYVPTEEVRQLWSRIRTGTKRSEETKKKMSASCAFRREDVKRKSAEAKFKKVTAYTLDGDFVGTYDSIIGACAELGLTNAQRGHISDCCNGIRKSSGGYKWEYA